MPFKFNPITNKLDLVENGAIPPVQQVFVTDAGTATSVADTIEIFGGANINTSGSGDTVTVALDSAVTTTSYATDNAATGLTIENNTITADGTNANIDIGLVAKGTTGGVYSPTHITIGQSASVASIPFAGSSIGVTLLVDNPGTTDAAGITELRHGTTANLGSNLILGRSRGTFAAPTIVQNGDSVGRIAFISYDGANYQYSAQIQCNVAAAPGVADTPGNLLLQTVPDGSSTPTTALTISSAQVVTLANALPVGSGGLGITTTPTNGQIPIGNGTNYTAATLTAGTGISITNAAGSVTVASTASAGIVLLQTITFNNTANSYDLTPYLTGSGYTSFEFYLSQVPCNNLSESADYEVSTDAGATFITTGYQSFFTFYEYAVGGPGFQASYKVNITNYLPGMTMNLASTDSFVQATTRLDGWLNPLGVSTLSRGALASSSSNYPMDYYGLGAYRNAIVNGLRIRKTGNFTAGTLSIYGITK